MRWRASWAGRSQRPIGAGRLWARLACAGLALLAAACTGAKPSARTTPGSVSVTTSHGSAASTPSAAPAGWPVYGHDLSNTRTESHDPYVTTSTVSHLDASWDIGNLVGVTGTPVVVGGTVYFGTSAGVVYAVDLATGRVLWRTFVASGEIVGSPAVTDGAVFVGIGGALYKLSASDGLTEWKAVTNTSVYAQINASPVVVGDLVVIGTAQFEEVVGKPPGTFRGSIGAFDVGTGKRVWNFVDTPNNSTSGAGEGIWSTPCVDPALGLLYVGTGQNISQPTGPLADSLLAIDYKTGRLRWYRQFTQHDVFGLGNFTGPDADVGASPNLWVSGGTEMVGVGQKNGIYHALNAATGKEVWHTRITPGSVFGGALGSAAFVDGMIIASSNVGDPENDSLTDESRVVALDPASGRIIWSRTQPGAIFGPISAVPGVAFFGTAVDPLGKVSPGRYYAVSTSTGKTLWSDRAPSHVGGGASIAGRNVLWGYGFTLFAGAGRGGLIDFRVG
jgi:polyvinyl alcohol dehydrogenase (cytochrome)